jgi:hypothetical protein
MDASVVGSCRTPVDSSDRTAPSTRGNPGAAASQRMLALTSTRNRSVRSERRERWGRNIGLGGVGGSSFVTGGSTSVNRQASRTRQPHQLVIPTTKARYLNAQNNENLPHGRIRPMECPSGGERQPGCRLHKLCENSPASLINREAATVDAASCRAPRNETSRKSDGQSGGVFAN